MGEFQYVKVQFKCNIVPEQKVSYIMSFLSVVAGILLLTTFYLLID